MGEVGEWGKVEDWEEDRGEDWEEDGGHVGCGGGGTRRRRSRARGGWEKEDDDGSASGALLGASAQVCLDSPPCSWPARSAERSMILGGKLQRAAGAARGARPNAHL